MARTHIHRLKQIGCAHVVEHLTPKSTPEVLDPPVNTSTRAVDVDKNVRNSDSTSANESKGAPRSLQK